MADDITPVSDRSLITGRALILDIPRPILSGVSAPATDRDSILEERREFTETHLNPHETAARDSELVKFVSLEEVQHWRLMTPKERAVEVDKAIADLEKMHAEVSKGTSGMLGDALQGILPSSISFEDRFQKKLEELKKKRDEIVADKEVDDHEMAEFLNVREAAKNYVNGESALKGTVTLLIGAGLAFAAYSGMGWTMDKFGIDHSGKLGFITKLLGAGAAGLGASSAIEGGIDFDALTSGDWSKVLKNDSSGWATSTINSILSWILPSQ